MSGYSPSKYRVTHKEWNLRNDLTKLTLQLWSFLIQLLDLEMFQVVFDSFIPYV